MRHVNHVCRADDENHLVRRPILRESAGAEERPATLPPSCLAVDELNVTDPWHETGWKRRRGLAVGRLRDMAVRHDMTRCWRPGDVYTHLLGAAVKPAR